MAPKKSHTPGKSSPAAHEDQGIVLSEPVSLLSAPVYTLPANGKPLLYPVKEDASEAAREASTVENKADHSTFTKPSFSTRFPSPAVETKGLQPERAVEKKTRSKKSAMEEAMELQSSTQLSTSLTTPTPARAGAADPVKFEVAGTEVLPHPDARSSRDAPVKISHVDSMISPADVLSSSKGGDPLQPRGENLIGKICAPENSIATRARSRSRSNGAQGKGRSAPGIVGRSKGPVLGDIDNNRFSAIGDKAFDSGLVVKSGFTLADHGDEPNLSRGIDEDQDLDNFIIRSGSLVDRFKQNTIPEVAAAPRQVNLSHLAEDTIVDTAKAPSSSPSPAPKRLRTDVEGYRGLSDENVQLLEMYSIAQRVVRDLNDNDIAGSRHLGKYNVDTIIKDAISQALGDPSEKNVLEVITNLAGCLVASDGVKLGSCYQLTARLHKFLARSLAQILVTIPEKMLLSVQATALVILAQIIATFGLIPLSADLHSILGELGLKTEVVNQVEPSLEKIYSQWFRAMANGLRFPLLERDVSTVPWKQIADYMDQLTYNEWLHAINITDRKLVSWARGLMSLHDGPTLVKELLSIAMNLVLTQVRFSDYKRYVEHIQVQSWFSISFQPLRFQLERKDAVRITESVLSILMKTVVSGQVFDLSVFPMAISPHISVMENDPEKLKKLRKEKGDGRSVASKKGEGKKGKGFPERTDHKDKFGLEGMTRGERKKSYDDLLDSDIGKKNMEHILCFYGTKCNKKGRGCPMAHERGSKTAPIFEVKTRNGLESFTRWCAANPGVCNSADSKDIDK